MIRGVMKTLWELLGGDRAVTRLFNAMKEGQWDNASSLLEKDPSLVKKKNRFGNTPLHTASALGNTEMTEFLLEHGADVNCCNTMGWTPLHMAGVEDHPGVIRQLIGAGADTEARDHLGQTPLHWAAQRGSTGAVQALLEKKADILCRNKKGNTPLSLAKSGGHQKTAEVIKKYRPKHAQ